MSIKIISQVIIFSFLIFNANSKDLSEVNFSYLYDGTLKVKHQLLLSNNKIDLSIRLNKNPESINFFFQKSYQDRNHLEISTHDSILVRNQQQGFVVQTKFENDLGNSLIVIELKIKDTVYYYDIPVNKGLKLNYPNFLLKYTKDSTPIFDNYLMQGQEAIFDNQIFCYAYQPISGIAAPPSSSNSHSGQKKLMLDSVFLVSNKMKLDSLNQLFFFQSDSSSNYGRSILVVPNYFPKLKLPSELIEPLIYLSTKMELEKLNKSADKKKAFENFWVSTLKSKQRAKQAIKNFYQNIAKANYYFTSHKIGWKTDPGMIYTIFGPPLFVQRNKKEEKWFYNRYGEVITFNFEKIPNLFVRQHLRLQRDIAHSKIWFREVSTWRKGSL